MEDVCTALKNLGLGVSIKTWGTPPPPHVFNCGVDYPWKSKKMHVLLFSVCLVFRTNYDRRWIGFPLILFSLKDWFLSLFEILTLFLFSDWTLRPRKNQTRTTGRTSLTVRKDFFNRRQHGLGQLVRKIEISGQFVADQNPGRRFQGRTRRCRCRCCRKDC